MRLRVVASNDEIRGVEQILCATVHKICCFPEHPLPQWSGELTSKLLKNNFFNRNI